MRTEKNIVVAGGTADIGSADAPRVSPAKRSPWTVTTRLVRHTSQSSSPNLKTTAVYVLYRIFMELAPSSAARDPRSSDPWMALR